MENNENFFIHLPVQLILTTQGQTLFKQTPGAVKKVKNREGMLKEGLESQSFNASSVQKLIMNSYLEEIYVSLPDLLRQRRQIIDTNNLVVFGILYKKLSPSLAEMMLNSAVLQDFNRKNPKAQITNLNNIDKAKLEAIRTAKKDFFEMMEVEINSEVVQRIISNPILEEEDRFLRMRSLEKFMGFIDKRIWYLYFVIYQSNMREEVRKSFADMIALYLDRTKLATHLSNLVMEFIQNSEKAHFERILVTQNIVSKTEVDKYLKDAQNRKFVIEEAIRKNQMLELSWNMNSETTSVGHTYRIQITISNYGLLEEKARSMLAGKMKTDVTGIPVSNFYKDSGDADKLGAGLGLLYISYLEDLCKKEKIKFNCNIFPEPSKEKTTVKIEIGL
ncbi:MAG: hypothetical protein K8R21_00460 [Leptospira sp.]|nr:hypothetical protein [Leptospira sp.]